MFRGRMTDHISSCAAVNGDADNTVSMKEIHIRRLTGLYTVGYDIWRRQNGIRNWRIRVEVAVGIWFVVEDANDLPRFYQ